MASRLIPTSLLTRSSTRLFSSIARPTNHSQPLKSIPSNHLRYTRTMSSDAARPPITTPPAGKYEFLVVIPDKPGTQQKRLEVRPKHFEGLQTLIESGVFKVGGAALNDTPEGTDATKWDFYGSTVVMVATSKEECREILSKDIYTTSGVWDVDNAQIWPVKLAFRYP